MTQPKQDALPTGRTRSSRGGCRRAALIIFVILLAISCTVAAAISYSWYASAVQVKQQLKQARLQKEPLTAQELDAYYNINANQADTTRLWLEAATEFKTPQFQVDLRPLPIIGLSTEPIPAVTETWPQYESVRQFLDRYEDSMQKLHEAAALGGAARYFTDFRSQKDEVTLVQDLRTIARMLQLEAFARAHAGDAHGAAQAIHAQLKLADSLSNYPSVLSQLVRMAISGMAYSSIQDLLPHLKFSDEDLLALQAALQEQQESNGLYLAMLGERVLGLMLMDKPAQLGGKMRMRGSPAPWRNSDRGFFLMYMASFVDAANADFPDCLRKAKQLGDEINNVARESAYARLKYSLSLQLLPTIPNVFQSGAEFRARCNLVQAGIAIERYRRQHSLLPAKLEQLADYMPGALVDPFDGQPLHYIVEGDGYRIYSIGRNGADNGGEGDLGGRPDIVFGIPAPKINGR